MQCVILAAGEGMRMQPLTLDTPKPMLKIFNKPILEYALEELPEEVNELIIVVGYLEEKIKAYFGDSFGGRLIRYVHQSQKLGTYHALQLCEPLLHSERFFVLNADDFFGPASYQRLINTRRMTILVMEVSDPWRFGVVTVHPDGTVQDIEEKPEHPKSKLANCGPCVLTKVIFKYPSEESGSGEHHLTHSISAMAKEHPVTTVYADWWLPIGYPVDLKRAEEFLSDKRRR